MPFVVIASDALRAIPRWARVALAARSARRVLPLFRRYVPDAPREEEFKLEEQVAAAEEAAATAGREIKRAKAVEFIDINKYNSRSTDVWSVILMPGEAVRAAIASTYPQPHPDPYHPPGFGEILSCFFTLSYIREGPVVGLAMWDCANLTVLSVRDGWTDDTPVPPDVNGPVWPTGESVEAAPITWAAITRLRELAGVHGEDVTVVCEVVGPERSPSGVVITVGVPKWELNESHTFEWASLGDGNYVYGVLAELWSRLLGKQSRKMYAGVERPEGAAK